MTSSTTPTTASHDDLRERIAELENLARTFVTQSGHTAGCKCDEWICRERERLLSGTGTGVVAVVEAQLAAANAELERVTQERERQEKRADAAITDRQELQVEVKQLSERLRESEAISASVFNREFIAKTLHNLTGGPQDESWEEANGSERAWPYRIADGLLKKLTKSKSDAARTVASH